MISCESPLDESELYDYSIEQKMLCFCGQANSWIKLFIKADTISTAYRISDNIQLNHNEFRFFKSIKGLFDLLNSTDTSKYYLEFTLDPTNSYPSHIYLSPKPIMLNDSTIIIIQDADLTYLTKNYIKLE